MPPIDEKGFQRAMIALGIDVSRETLDKLKIYADLIVKWNASINLVGQSTMQSLWERHFLDSAQLLPLIAPDERIIADFGSGAGFPGLVLAILSDRNIHLIESDSRKCAFLRQVAIETKILSKITIHNTRIESLEPFSIDIAVSRALAPLDRLIEWVFPFVGKEGRCLFHKGKQSEEELILAKKRWNMVVDKRRSLIDAQSSILIVSQLRLKKLTKKSK